MCSQPTHTLARSQCALNNSALDSSSLTANARTSTLICFFSRAVNFGVNVNCGVLVSLLQRQKFYVSQVCCALTSEDFFIALLLFFIFYYCYTGYTSLLLLLLQIEPFPDGFDVPAAFVYAGVMAF